jgi:fructosamine-3-kinase
MDMNTKRLRQRAPQYLQSIIEQTHAFPSLSSLDQLESDALTVITGGMLSANYLLRLPDEQAVVIKLLFEGAEAEAEALAFWHRSGANVVEVIRAGTVPKTKRTKHPVKYLILEGVLDHDSRPAPTCQQYVTEHPSATLHVGRLLGRELAKMHTRTTYRTFGEYADLPNANAPFKSWNAYLEGYIDMHHDYLLTLNIVDADIDRLRHAIRSSRFSSHGRYIHGDFSLRNALIEKRRPLTVKIFDPNPTIGDASWDLAVLQNNHDFSRRKAELAPNNNSYHAQHRTDHDIWRGVVRGYETVTRQQINMYHIVLSQIMQTIFLLQIEEKKKRMNRKRYLSRGHELEVRIRSDNLLTKLRAVTHPL